MHVRRQGRPTRSAGSSFRQGLVGPTSRSPRRCFARRCGSCWPTSQLALARDYRLWCERRHKPSDCLDLLRERAVLTPEGRYKLAFDFALGAEWDGFTSELRGMADPAVVKVVLLGAMVAYMALIAVPELVTKGIAAAATVVLTAYLGAQTVWNLVAGWSRLVRDADAATTFSQLRAAGERYGRLVGAQTARVLVDVHGGPWTQRFERIFKRAEMTLDAPENVIEVPGHKGPHPEAYHQEVYLRLYRATLRCSTTESCREALVGALRELRRELATPGSDLNKLVTRC